MTTVARSSVFNRQGLLIEEIEPAWEFVNWRLNHPGMCRFSMAWTDAKCTPDVLRSGNRLYVEFDAGLPAWGGVIDYPFRVEHGRVTVTGYTGEHFLDWRVTNQNRRYYDEAPANIVISLMDESDAISNLPWSAGNLYVGGEGRSTKYHFHDLLKRVQDMAKLSGQDFAVRPVVSSSPTTIRFVLDWFWRRGTDKTGSAWLVEGRNVAEATLDIQGPVANRVVLAGAGNDWEDDRLTAEASDAESQSVYGHREYSKVQAGVTTQSTLDRNAEAILDRMKAPRRLISLQAVDEQPAPFAEYGIGDIVHAELFQDNALWFYEGSVRVIAREWRPGAGCRLEVEEWPGY